MLKSFELFFCDAHVEAFWTFELVWALLSPGGSDCRKLGSKVPDCVVSPGTVKEMGRPREGKTIGIQH